MFEQHPVALSWHEGLGKTRRPPKLIVRIEGTGRAAKDDLFRDYPIFEQFTKDLIGRVKFVLLTIGILIPVVLRIHLESENDLLARGVRARQIAWG